MRRFGVDEAGKGPVLGSMFAACVVADPDSLPAGLRDSKKLTPARREELDAALRDTDGVRLGVAEVPVGRIDDPGTDMNTLTVDAHAAAIDAANADGRGIVDAGDTSEERFASRVEAAADRDVEVTAEHGADDAHSIVAAASVVAKVARDAHVDALADEYGNVGSGYPSDPTTREFLAAYVRERGELPGCARASWSTCDDVLAAAEQSALSEF
ncbi:ribonuclease HII [Salarchaeum sp. JOR-1]|uniref:ribonuclease HII n=1 Tax=Salarchaeum sp. JOR-1 TaxID=2599399 RepID=UPI0011988006|nr:ribonuclease HII [Salarchaeum sp. JOR-1]QDX40511.1 ribonuclease HII [Salarchaeum sp. JOR-1]